MLYLVPIILILAYAVYSWYWQAMISIYARYRISSVIWSVILLAFGLGAGFINTIDRSLTWFLAGFMLTSIVDGFGGLSESRIIISGYFKRALKYDELTRITMIPIPNPNKTTVMVIFTTIKSQSFYMRFNKSVEDLIPLLNEKTTNDVQIEIQNLM